MIYSKKPLPDYRAEEPSTGSNVIPRRACPGLAGLRLHTLTVLAGVQFSEEAGPSCSLYRGTSLIRNSPQKLTLLVGRSFRRKQLSEFMKTRARTEVSYVDLEHKSFMQTRYGPHMLLLGRSFRRKQLSSNSEKLSCESQALEVGSSGALTLHPRAHRRPYVGASHARSWSP